ncbi:hypothetical protein GCM10022207_52420 [Streptomyces lannensis]|uniref:Uncharacterized protein n=1 Tax=Streptomyces lannensis TaxID=766498 RepID=A0ABP7KIW7_9ACTN
MPALRAERDDGLAQRPAVRLRLRPPFGHHRARVGDAPGAEGAVVLGDDRILLRQWPVGVAVGEIDAPQQPGEPQRRGGRDLLEPDPVLLLLGPLLGGADDDLGARQDPQVIVGSAEGAQAGADVLGEGECVIEVVAEWRRGTRA